MGRLFDFMLPENKSPLTADSTDGLFHFINEVSLIFLIGITFALIYFAFKYKRKSEDDKTPVITHNNARNHLVGDSIAYCNGNFWLGLFRMVKPESRS